MIGIRADANSIIATGHMMRCITIARALVVQGESVTFFMADDESGRLLRSFAKDEFEGVVLGTDYRNMESETEALEKELKEREIQILLVDSYSVTKAYFERLSKMCKVAYLDDLAKEAYPVNIVINYSGYSKNMGYDKLYTGVKGYGDRDSKLFLGLKYAPLREQFYNNLSGVTQKADMENDSLSILLATGGSDMCNMITSVLDKARENGLVSKETKLKSSGIGDYKGVKWHVVVGDFVEKPEEIEQFAGEYEDIIIHRSVKNMAKLMRSCDLGVLAAGTMLTECAACSLPAIFYQVADNQKYNVEYFGGLKGMLFAGEVQNSESEKNRTVDRIIDGVKRLSCDRGQLKAMGDSLLEITDGRGAERIARALMDEIR